MVSEQTADQTLELANLVATNDELWQTYAPLLGKFYPEMRKEFDTMAAKHGRGEIDWKRILAAATPKEIIESGTAKKVVDELGVDGLLAILTPQQRREIAKRLEAGKK
jgi:carbamate kinase